MTKFEKFKWNFRHYGGWKLLLAAVWLSLLTFVSYQIIGEQLVPDKARPWGIAVAVALTAAGLAVINKSLYPNRVQRRKMVLSGLVLLGLGAVTSLLVSAFTYFLLTTIGLSCLYLILFRKMWRNYSP